MIWFTVMTFTFEETIR